jgi:hypothetical protein
MVGFQILKRETSKVLFSWLGPLSSVSDHFSSQDLFCRGFRCANLVAVAITNMDLIHSSRSGFPLLTFSKECF